MIADRLVSLADPDARPIRKGKPQHPTQFGYTRLLAEGERGFICDHQLQQGNPPDAPQLVPAIGRVIAVTGRPPGTVVADRGLGTAANDEALDALGVNQKSEIGSPLVGKPGRMRRLSAAGRPGARRPGSKVRRWEDRRTVQPKHARDRAGGQQLVVRGLPGERDHGALKRSPERQRHRLGGRAGWNRPVVAPRFDQASAALHQRL